MKAVPTGQFRQVIEAYFDERELDIACRRRRRGYALYISDDEPLARLCPTGEGDIVEIDWWDGNHWKPVTEFGLALPLRDALDYVMDDTDGVFFDEEDDGYEDDDEAAPDAEAEADAVNVELANAVTRGVFRLTLTQTVTCSLLGAVCGGVVVGASRGLLYGAGGAVAFCFLYSLFKLSFRNTMFCLVFSGAPSMVLAGAAGAVGAAVSQAMGGGIWASLGGAVLAAVCFGFTTFGGWPARFVGFAGGLNLGIAVADGLGVRDAFWGALAIAGLAAVTSILCCIVGDVVSRAIRDSQDNTIGDLGDIRFMP